MLDFLRCTKIYEFWFKTIPNCFHHNTSSNRRKQIIIRVKVGNYSTKGDGNDGEPDALEKLEMEKKAKNWLELKNCGWLGSYLKNIQSDLPNETRGQS